MKNLIIENSFSKNNIIAESVDNGTFISGTFATADLRNANGRIYPLAIWQEAVEKYQYHIQNKTQNLLMSLEHTDNDFTDLSTACGMVTALWIEGSEIKGKAKLLNNPLGNQLKAILNEGICLGVSSKGTGDCDANGMVFEYELISFDIVSDKSDSTAYAKLLESRGFKNGMKPLKNKIETPVLSKEDILKYIKSL